MSDVSMMYWSTHIPFKSTHVAFDDDMLLLCATRSWMGLGRMTRTSSPPPTLDSARPSRRTRRLTPTCSPGHSRTKPFMCTGSRRSARRAARARRIPVRLSSRSEGPPANPRPPPSEERDGGEEEIKALNPRCSSVSSLHCAQLWSCPLFF